MATSLGQTVNGVVGAASQAARTLPDKELRQGRRTPFVSGLSISQILEWCELTEFPDPDGSKDGFGVNMLSEEMATETGQKIKWKRRRRRSHGLVFQALPKLISEMSRTLSMF
ncbi:hypothetical protein NC653_016075 [Populus alba x Populus x berolinensis]|uniref:Uncharacterized protein n=1 Tax=Populus alba x Populus x berolinensis TaxID=444605 RepID=A0AAD6QM31_9ROSI|nr:hypothetical protein NC653_016075 [Populus alba x Populus x berolinensis]